MDANNADHLSPNVVVINRALFLGILCNDVSNSVYIVGSDEVENIPAVSVYPLFFCFDMAHAMGQSRSGRDNTGTQAALLRFSREFQC